MLLARAVRGEGTDEAEMQRRKSPRGSIMLSRGAVRDAKLGQEPLDLDGPWDEDAKSVETAAERPRVAGDNQAQGRVSVDLQVENCNALADHGLCFEDV